MRAEGEGGSLLADERMGAEKPRWTGATSRWLRPPSPNLRQMKSGDSITVLADMMEDKETLCVHFFAWAKPLETHVVEHKLRGRFVSDETCFAVANVGVAAFFGPEMVLAPFASLHVGGGCWLVLPPSSVLKWCWLPLAPLCGVAAFLDSEEWCWLPLTPFMWVGRLNFRSSIDHPTSYGPAKYLGKSLRVGDSKKSIFSYLGISIFLGIDLLFQALFFTIQVWSWNIDILL